MTSADRVSLVGLLDRYCELVGALPVPLPPSDRELTRLEKQIVAVGPRVTDRLAAGLTAAEVDRLEERLGFGVPAQVRDWVQWANGHVLGAFDPEDQAACLFVHGRQLDVETGIEVLSSRLTIMGERRPVLPEHPLLLLEGDDEKFLVDCGTQDGVVWLWSVIGDLFEPVYDSLADLVANAIGLCERHLLRLNHLGGVGLVPGQEMEAAGVVFESEWESYRYHSYGLIPASLR